MYFGYKLDRGESSDGQILLIAQPEKAIVDYMYFHHEIKTLWDIRALDWDKERLGQTISLSALSYMASRCGIHAVGRRVAMVDHYLRYGGHPGGGRPVDTRW